MAMALFFSLFALRECLLSGIRDEMVSYLLDYTHRASHNTGSCGTGGLCPSRYEFKIAGAVMLIITTLLMFFSMRLRSELMLLVVGMMTGYLTSSVVTLLSSLSTAQGVHGYVMWGMGTFGAVSSARIPVFTLLVAVGLILSLLLAKPLNLLLLGDNYARNLGVRVHRVRNLLLLVTGVLTAIVTAYCGPVAFIGLAMPHVARMIMRTDNHWILIPATMLSGAAVALGCNVLSVLPDSTVIPVNALTPVVGVPVILYVIFRRK